MKDQEKTTSDIPTAKASRPSRPWRTRILAWTLGAVMGGMAVGAVSHAGMGHFCGPFGHGPWAAAGVEAVEERRHWIGFGVDRMLTRIDASDQQKTEVKAIVERLADEMHPLRLDAVANRKALIELLTQAEVDRAGLEALRERQMTQAQEMSNYVVAALGEAAAVLTPEQRVALGERFERRRH